MINKYYVYFGENAENSPLRMKINFAARMRRKMSKIPSQKVFTNPLTDTSLMYQLPQINRVTVALALTLCYTPTVSIRSGGFGNFIFLHSDPVYPQIDFFLICDFLSEKSVKNVIFSRFVAFGYHQYEEQAVSDKFRTKNLKSHLPAVFYKFMTPTLKLDIKF